MENLTHKRCWSSGVLHVLLPCSWCWVVKWVHSNCLLSDSVFYTVWSVEPSTWRGADGDTGAYSTTYSYTKHFLSIHTLLQLTHQLPQATTTPPICCTGLLWYGGTHCGGEGGWTRVTYINMTQVGTTCPQGLEQMSFNGSSYCMWLVITWTGLCGQAAGYQEEGPDAF